MKPLVFEQSCDVACSAEELFHWHEAPDAFRKLMPPGEPVTILHHDGHIRDGARAVLLVGRWPFRLHWELMHRDYRFGALFCDEQVKGPFVSYRHEHRFTPLTSRSCRLTDRIMFVLPGGWLGNLLGAPIIMSKFRRLFTYRHRVTREAFA